MENSLYRQYNNYSSMYVKKTLSKADNWIKQIFIKAWGKNGVECNKLNFQDEMKLNQAIIAFEKLLIENTDKNKYKYDENKHVESKNKCVENKTKYDDMILKANFIEYFKKENYSKVLTIIKEYREKNPYYYYVLSKFYSKDFDLLQEDATVTKKDLIAFKDAILDIKNKLEIEANKQNNLNEIKKELKPTINITETKIKEDLKPTINITKTNIKEEPKSIINIKKVKIKEELKPIINIKKTNVNEESKPNINNKKITKITDVFQIKSLAEYFQTTDKNISEAVEYLSAIERQCIKLYFGIDMRRFSLKEMENILDMKEEDIVNHIKKSIITMGNAVRIVKDRDNKEKVIAKIKVKPKAYKKQ